MNFTNILLIFKRLRDLKNFCMKLYVSETLSCVCCFPHYTYLTCLTLRPKLFLKNSLTCHFQLLNCTFCQPGPSAVFHYDVGRRLLTGGNMAVLSRDWNRVDLAKNYFFRFFSQSSKEDIRVITLFLLMCKGRDMAALNSKDRNIKRRAVGRKALRTF